MQSFPGICQLTNHDANEISHICTDRQCNKPRRLLCIECLRQQLHNHRSNSEQTVLSLEKFRSKYVQRYEAYNINQKKLDIISLLKALKQIEQNIHECRDQARQYSQYFTNIQQIQEILLNQDARSLSNEQINDLIINMNSSQESDFSIIRNILQGIIIQTQKQVQSIDQMNSDFIQVQRQEDISILQPDHSVDSQQNMNQIQNHENIKHISEIQQNVASDLQYNNQLYQSQITEQMKKSQIKIKIQINQQQEQQEQQKQQEQLTEHNNYVQVFQHRQDKTINNSAISENEKYFAFVQDYKVLRILNLSDKNIIYDEEFKYSLSVIKFSNDSKKIFVGSSIGTVEYFTIQSNIRKIPSMSHPKQIHESSINRIIFLKQQQILTCSDDRCLIITDYEQSKLILKIENAHSSQIYGMDYDDIKDVIVSSSEDLSILFYNKKNNFEIFRKEYAHNYRITQINLIKKGSYLLSSDGEQMNLWEINYNNNQISLINQFQVNYEMNQIYPINPYRQQFTSYFSVFREEQVYLVKKGQIIILDFNFIQIQEIQTKFDDYTYIKRVNQPSLQYYLILQSDTQIQVLKKQTLKY